MFFDVARSIWISFRLLHYDAIGESLLKCVDAAVRNIVSDKIYAL